MMASLFLIVESLWAITNTVRPFIRLSIPFCTILSVRVSILEVASSRILSLIHILITVLSIIFSVILFKYGMDKVITQLQNGKRTFVLNWPEWIFWSFVPIGAGCMILHFIEFCLDFCCKTDSAKNTDNSTKSNMNTITTDKKEGK